MNKRIQFIILLLIMSASFLFLIMCEKLYSRHNESLSLEIGSLEETVYSWKGDSYGNVFFLPYFLSEQKVNIPKGCSVMYGSDEVSSLFINTSTGFMDEIYNKKSHKEQVNLALLSSDGELVSNDVNVYMKGRGNSTWNQEKKSFTLSFSDSLEVPDVGKSKKWILLANAFDYTNLKNAMVFSVAKEIGLENTPNYFYVDLYLNGEYNGLYLMTEAVETFADDDVVLCKSDTSDEGDFRISTHKITVTYPPNNSEQELESMKNLFKGVDLQIHSGMDLSDVIDLDSWAKKYLIDEIFENFDAGINSNYFYWYNSDSNRKIYGGPVWDYDISISIFNSTRTTLNPQIIYAAQEKRSPARSVMWYKALCDNESFYNNMVRIFSDVVEPVVTEWKDTCLYEKYLSILDSARNNNIRWGDKILDTEMEEMSQWLNERLQFLSNYWSNPSEYHSVEINLGGTNNYVRFYPKTGESLQESKYYYNFFTDDTKFVSVDTDTLFLPTDEIYEDLSLHLVREKGSIVEKIRSNMDVVIAMVSMGILCLLVVIMSWGQFKQSSVKGTN